MFDPTHWNVYPHGMGYMSLQAEMCTRMREVKKASGKRQYEMSLGFHGEPFMMLVSDMCL